MRSLLLLMEFSCLIPIALARPFVGVLMWSWVSFMNPHQLAWGFVSTAPWAQIIFAATMFGCLVAREPKRFPLSPLTLLIIAFMVLISITSLTAMASSDLVFEKWSTVSKVCLFLLVTAALLTSKTRIHALLWMMVISLGYYGTKGGLFSLIHGGSYKVEGPPLTMIGDNNQLAAALLVALPLMNYLRLQSPHRIVRIGLLVAMGLTLMSVLGSWSRGALIGLLAVALFLWWKSPRKLVPGMVIVAVVAGGIAFMPADWMQRMESINSYQADDSAEGRIQMWHTSWNMAVERPLVGSGFMGPYTQWIAERFLPGVHARAVHSIYFEVLGEHGFPAFFVWLGMSITGWISARRILRLTKGVPDLGWANDLARMSQVSIIAYLVAGAFLSLSYWDFYLTLLVVIVATWQQVRQQVGQTSVRGWQRPGLVPSRLALSR